MEITDGTHGPVAVKAASTAAAAADPSLVVALSPNSPVPAGTNTIGAVNQGTPNTVANSWPMEITDGTHGPVAVKAASTAAVAADPSLVVALSPNSPVPTGTNTIGKVDILGNAGAIMDATLAAGAAPTNGLATLAQYNTTQPAPTNTQTQSLQSDQSGNLLEFPGVQTKTGAAWTSGTALNTLQYPTGTATIGAPLGGEAVLVQLDQTTTLTGGAVTFQGTYDGINWVTVPTAQVLNPQTFTQLTNPYTFVASTNQPFLILLQGFQNIRISLTTVITGTGSVTPYWTVLAVVSTLSTSAGNTNVNIADVGGVAITGTQGLVPVDLSQAETVFKHVVVSGRLPQIQVSFNLVGPATLLTSTLTGTGSVAGPTNGTGSFATGTGTTGRSLGVSFTTVAYSPHEELYSAFTAAFTTGTTGTYQRIGFYNTTDGFSFGYNGTTFGLWTRFNGTDTFVAQTSWNTDTLSGAATSKFTRAGTPEALVPTDINLYRVRFGWLGIAPVIFEVFSADGTFVTVHIARFPNSQTTVSITSPYLPMTVDVNNNSTGTTSLTLITGCWVAGTSASPVVGGGLTASIVTVNTNGNTGPATTGSSVSAPTIGIGAVGFNITGTWSGTITFQFSMDGNVWDTVMAYNPQTGAFQSTTTANGTWSIATGSYRSFRAVATAFSSGTAFITANGGAAPSIINTLTALTDGANDGPVAVKPASTAAATTDPALVVALSPNTPDHAIFNTTTSAPANGTVTALQSDLASNLLTFPGVQFATGAAWTSATAVNTLQYSNGTTTIGQYAGAQAILIQLDQTTTLTGGAVTFQGTYDGINWVNIPVGQILSPNTLQPLSNPYTFVASTNQPFLILLSGYVHVRLNLTTVITGTGSVTPYWAKFAAPPITQLSNTIAPLYGTNNQALTITLASLASAAVRGSTAVNNSTTLYEDVLLFFKFETATTGTSATGYINVYAYGSVDGGATYTESFGGTDGAATLATPPNATLIAQVNANANATIYRAGPVSLARLLGVDRIPQYWGVFVQNETGAALNATAGNQAVTYQGVNGQLA
jgi:hypothetical protein